MLPVGVLERDDAGRFVADDERHENPRLRLLALDDAGADLRRPLGEPVVDHDRLFALHRDLVESAERDHLLREPHASFDRVREVHHPGLAVEDADGDDL